MELSWKALGKSGLGERFSLPNDQSRRTDADGRPGRKGGREERGDSQYSRPGMCYVQERQDECNKRRVSTTYLSIESSRHLIGSSRSVTNSRPARRGLKVKEGFPLVLLALELKKSSKGERGACESNKALLTLSISSNFVRTRFRN